MKGLKAAFTVCLCALSLVACMGKKSKDEKPEHIPQKEATTKPDFHKAALLNIEMGQAYLAQGQLSRAKQKFVHALQLQPKLAEAHSAIGYFYESVGDIEEAEKHHSQAISYGSGKGRFYNNYGTFLCRQQRFKEADRAFNNALKDKQYLKTAEVYENAGLCALQQADNSEKAYKYLKTAVKNDPKRALATLELANLELKRNNSKAALYYLNAYRKNNQPTPKSLWISIQTFKRLNQKNELASAALQLKSLYPESDEYKAYLESQK